MIFFSIIINWDIMQFDMTGCRIKRKETTRMRQYVRRLFLVLGLMLMLTSVCSAEENMCFVDARNDTGYYVDTDTISADSDHEYTANIAVIKADTNRMYVYQTHFDFNAMTYQILNAEVMAYDTKTVLGTSGTSLSVRHYGIASPMKSIVDYIYAFQHGAAN